MKRDISWYLERGFDRRMAEYFATGSRRITAVAGVFFMVSLLLERLNL